jgi:hypothetical protein
MLLARGQIRLLSWVNVHWADSHRGQLQRLLPQYWPCPMVYWNSTMRIERQYTKSTGSKRQARRDTTNKYTPYSKDSYRSSNRNVRSMSYNNNYTSNNYNNEWRTSSRYQEERESNAYSRSENRNVAVDRHLRRNDYTNVTTSSHKLPSQLRFYPNEGGLFENSVTDDYLLRRATQLTQRPLLVLDLNGTLMLVL